jgi:putative ABC transport system permease protein
MSPIPPPLARAVIAFASEPADRPWILADLDEEFQALAVADPRGARRWYWHQALASVFPLVRRRVWRRPPSYRPARPEMLNGFRTELRHAVRAAARTPAPTGAILLTMGLGIGAAAAVSAVVWKVLLQPLPISEPERVLAVYRVAEQTGAVNPSVAYPDLLDWRRQAKSLVGLAPYTDAEGTLIKEEGPVPLRIAQVGTDFFAVLTPRFAIGRAFSPEEFLTAESPVVILSGALWQRDFGGDRAIVGRSIQLATGPATVVGVVAPGEFTLPLGGADLWTPLHVPTSGPNAWMNSRATHWLQAIARVRSDVSVNAAVAELRAIDRAVQRDFPRPSNGLTVMGVAPLEEFIAGPVRTMLLFLAGAIVIVLLLVCTNIANLRFVQAQVRERDFAMRLMLGASVGRLRRQVVTESLLLALGGAVVGLVLAHPILRGLLGLYPGSLPHAGQIGLDAGVTGWSIVVAIVAGLLFAVPQMLHVGRIDAGRVAKERERGASTRGQRMARRGMVVVQLALSVVMLVASGLLVRTYLRVTRVSPGFDASGVLSFALAAPAGRYPTPQATEQLFDAIGERLRALPGVRMVGATNALPLTFNPWRNGVPKPNADPSAPGIPVNMRLVSPEYLELLRVPITRGRPLARTDDQSAPGVALISDALAAQLFPGDDPIGKPLPGGGPFGRTIVGVVAKVHHTSLTAPPDDELYIPFRQVGVRRSRVLAIRVDGDPSQLQDAVQRAVRAVDPQLPIRSMRTLDEIVSAAIAPQQFRAAFIASLAVLALALAVVGVYGVMSYAVAERRRELGIRVALGESPARIRRRVVGEALGLAALGSAIGGAGAFLAARALRSMMFEVSPGDAWTLASVAAVLTVATVLAADGPARRAGRVDPVAAMRGE